MTGRPRSHQVGPEGVLDYLDEYINTWGISPTVRDIMAGVGLKSHSTVHHALIVLRNEGKVKWMPGKARSIRVLDPSPKKEATHVPANDHDR